MVSDVRHILKLVEKSKTDMIGWNTWHIDDKTDWYNDLTPSLFNTIYIAKPAYYAVQKVLEGK